MPTVTINQEGGLVIANASSVPTGHTIQMSSNQTWMKVYKNNQTSAAASASSNTSASARSCTVTVTATTTTNSSYNPTSVSITCAWTVTQTGTGSTPTAQTLNIQWVQGLFTNNVGSQSSYSYSTSDTAITCDHGNEGTALIAGTGEYIPAGDDAVIGVGHETLYDVNNTITRFRFNEPPSGVLMWQLTLEVYNSGGTKVLSDTITNGSGSRTISFDFAPYGNQNLIIAPIIVVTV